MEGQIYSLQLNDEDQKLTNLSKKDILRLNPSETSFLINIRLNKTKRTNSIEIAFLEKIKVQNWNLLQTLSLSGHKLGSKSCKIISQGNWPILNKLNLSGNAIEAAGCLHLSKRSWPFLKTLNINNNLLDHEGVRWAVIADMKCLENLKIAKNTFKLAQTSQFATGKWDKMLNLDLEETKKIVISLNRKLKHLQIIAFLL